MKYSIEHCALLASVGGGGAAEFMCPAQGRVDELKGLLNKSVTDHAAFIRRKDETITDQNERIKFLEDQNKDLNNAVQKNKKRGG